MPTLAAEGRHAIELGWVLGRRDYRVRYRGSLIGVLWGVLAPGLQITFLAVIIGRILRPDRPHYWLFLGVGLVAWLHLSQTISVGTVSITDNANLVRRLPISPLAFPAAAVVSGILNAWPSAAAVLLASIAVQGVGWPLLALPAVALLQVALVGGCATALSAWHVTFRDVRYLVELGLALGFYATPVLFTEEQVPAVARPLVTVNPMAGLLGMWRWSLLGEPLDPGRAVVTSSVCLAALAIGVGVLGRKRADVADRV